MKKLFGLLTFWRGALAVLLMLGLYATYVRFFEGFTASTNLTDEYPWGIWMGCNILCGVGLAAAGFTLCAIVYIFNLHEFKPIVRPAILTAFLGYLSVIVSLMFELGQPWRIWYAIIFWNPQSVLFEVAWCVMLYTTVLTLEFSPMLFEKLRWEKPLRAMRAITIPLVIVGVILSTLHQSSLGSLYLIVPEKLHPLWYSSLLPVLFYLSAVGAGCALMIFESFLIRRAFKRELPFAILVQLGRAVVVILALYTVIRVQDLLHRHALGYLFTWNLEALLYWIEMMLGVLLPLMLLAWKKTRLHPRGLFVSSTLVILGFVMNRMNVSITGLEGWAKTGYFPSFLETAISVMIVAMVFGAFALAARYLPVFPKSKEKQPVYLEESTHVLWAE